ncbi:hypothetical protein L3X38_017962 [Prunus dulcis]|uniref:Uncharacterized protein n=1 Tax=Prunus dulcis TaxID=3755 RepID=A0AAD4W861_PRUDU|nr:hypothetical protein L3X38_017962 [Prunus dulcis]
MDKIVVFNHDIWSIIITVKQQDESYTMRLDIRRPFALAHHFLNVPVEEHNAKVSAAGKVAADLAEQGAGAAKQMTTTNEHAVKLGGAMEGVVDQAEGEEVTDQ